MRLGQGRTSPYFVEIWQGIVRRRTSFISFYKLFTYSSYGYLLDLLLLDPDIILFENAKNISRAGIRNLYYIFKWLYCIYINEFIALLVTPCISNKYLIIVIILTFSKVGFHHRMSIDRLRFIEKPLHHFLISVLIY